MKFFILLLSLNFFSCNAQEKDCSKFKTGTFKYADSNLKDWVITRTETLQVEKNSTTGRVLTSKVEWVSDCQYNLVFTDVNSPDKSIVGKKVEVTILSTNKNSYNSNSISGKEKASSKLIKIK